MTNNQTHVSKLQDKVSIMHIFAKIMDDITVLGNDREFPLEVDDFVEPFHKIIFGVMKNLYLEGATSVDIIDIDGTLRRYDKPYEVFNLNNGIEYLNKIKETISPNNFEMHYHRLKKYSFLRACVKEGINIKHIIDIDEESESAKERQQKRFDKYSLEELVENMEGKIIDLREKFLFDNDNTSGKMGDNASEILADMLSGQSYGAQLISPYFTGATLGANMGKLFMVSANSGVGKTRWNLGNALQFTVPEYYNVKTGEWEINKGATGDGALYTGTELEEEEVVQPLLCAIAGIDQTEVLEGRINEEEKERLYKAVGILEKTPLYFEKLADFDLNDIEHSISKHINKYGVRYIIHDYVHDSSKLMSYFKKIGGDLAEHQRLLMVMTRLKDLAQRYNVFIMTSTQLNSHHKMDGAMDETAIAGAKSMVNKVDIGAIMSQITHEDEVTIKSVMQSQPGLIKKVPNMTINIFKSRGTKWTMVRVWTYFDRGVLRMEDQFVTDYNGKLIENLKPIKVEIDKENGVTAEEIPVVRTASSHVPHPDSAEWTDIHDELENYNAQSGEKLF